MCRGQLWGTVLCHLMCPCLAYACQGSSSVVVHVNCVMIVTVILIGLDACNVAVQHVKSALLVFCQAGFGSSGKACLELPKLSSTTLHPLQ